MESTSFRSFYISNLVLCSFISLFLFVNHDFGLYKGCNEELNHPLVLVANINAWFIHFLEWFCESLFVLLFVDAVWNYYDYI